MHNFAILEQASGIVGTGLNEHHARGFLGVSGIIQTDQPSSVGMSDKHEGRFDSIFFDQRVQLVNDLA
jgi:hypothetical protein